jgi:hypothetical protein
MEIYGLNLLSLSASLSAEIYSEIFGMKIIEKSEKHSEIQSSSGIKIIFSPDDKNCRVSPGSITIQGSPSEKFIQSDFFKIEQTFPHNKYLSYLDKYDNRIWFILN